MTLPYGAAAALASAYAPVYATPSYHAGSVELQAPAPCGAVVTWTQQVQQAPTPRCPIPDDEACVDMPPCRGCPKGEGT